MRDLNHSDQAIVEAIRSHLAWYPDARDTPRGVQEWWLPEPVRSCTLEEITRTLWRMVDDDALVATSLVNGTTLFARKPGACGTE